MGFFTTMALAIMLETGLKQWLNSKDEPGDFYQLVGLPRLSRDQARLLALLQEATEYLFAFQNHKDKTIRDRARAFQLQVAEARRIVSDRGRWDKYDQDIINRLRTLCRKNPTFFGPNSKLDDLRRWLALVQQVDPARVDELVHLLRTEPEENPTARRPEENETLSSESLPTQVLGSPNRGVELSDPEIPKKPAFVSTPKPVTPEVSNPRKDAPPPPPPSRGAAPPVRGPAGKAPPPPPKDAPRAGAVPSIVITTQSVPPVMHPLPHSQAANTTLLWVVMGVVLGLLGLIVLVLSIAWASGAFESRPSRAASDRTGVPVSVNVPEVRPRDFIMRTSCPGEGFC
jgi:hypothetical protein